MFAGPLQSGLAIPSDEGGARQGIGPHAPCGCCFRQQQQRRRRRCHCRRGLWAVATVRHRSTRGLHAHRPMTEPPSRRGDPTPASRKRVPPYLPPRRQTSGLSAVAQLAKPPAARLDRVGGVEHVPLRTAGMPVVRAHRLRRVAALVEEPANVLGVGSRSIAGVPLTKLAVLWPAEPVVVAALDERRVTERASADFRDQPAHFPKRAPRRMRKARASDFCRAPARSVRAIGALGPPSLSPSCLRVSHQLPVPLPLRRS